MVSCLKCEHFEVYRDAEGVRRRCRRLKVDVMDAWKERECAAFETLRTNVKRVVIFEQDIRALLTFGALTLADEGIELIYFGEGYDWLEEEEWRE